MSTIEKLYAGVFLLIGVFLALNHASAGAGVLSNFGKQLNAIVYALQGRNTSSNY